MSFDQTAVDKLFECLFRFSRKKSALETLVVVRQLYDQYHRLLARAERLEARALAAEEQLRRVTEK
jgi:hypothetical protein